jgi:hypothetical protein
LGFSKNQFIKYMEKNMSILDLLIEMGKATTAEEKQMIRDKIDGLKKQREQRPQIACVNDTRNVIEI